ncbi:MAG TPA: PrsW family glutamic-type intramembrane protease [Candidatus Eisenbacteria bacterium]|nr:PrsW family glutamic-type intramembrane protease [Candidatus Eisenbacteria bacterium]
MTGPPSLLGTLPLLLGFLPVLLFLAALLVLDSYKLVSRKSVLTTLAAGALSAGIAFAVNRALLGWGLDPGTLRGVVAPVVEESVKAAFVLHLLRRAKVGFMVDAAIRGFAIGAGFAVVENLYYARSLGDFGLGLWVVRGLGTAIMHGCATAIVGVAAKQLMDRHETRAAWALVPGLLVAVAVHALFNQFPLHPLLATAILALTMPLLTVAVFERSEKATQEWLTVEFDSDADLLQRILSDDLEGTHVGRYLATLRERFEGTVVADMLCLLRIHLELALRAKGMLVARAAGVDVPPDEHVRANLAELDYLRKSIGATGMLAMDPVLKASGRDLWQLRVLHR